MAKQLRRRGALHSRKWLLLDAGNTALTLQGLDGAQYSDLFSILNNDIPKKLQKIASSGLIDSDTNLALVSVVPKNSQMIKKILARAGVKNLWTVGDNLPIKFKHNYNKFNDLGNDRKVNIYGALQLYNGPSLVMSFGTALTVDYISEQGRFEGGFIIPGPQTAFTTLAQKGALLPKNLHFPIKMAGFLGQSTSKCMENGILLGYAAMADGLIQRLKHRYGTKTRIIATGGFAQTLLPLKPSFDIVDPSHTLRSLALLALEHTQTL